MSHDFFGLIKPYFDRYLNNQVRRYFDRTLQNLLTEKYMFYHPQIVLSHQNDSYCYQFFVSKTVDLN